MSFYEYFFQKSKEILVFLKKSIVHLVTESILRLDASE